MSLTREQVLDALYRPVPKGCCGRCGLERELHRDRHPRACMSFTPARTCGACGAQDIPIMDWPWWREGKPVHRTCMERRERE